MVRSRLSPFYREERELPKQPLFSLLNREVIVVLRNGEELYGRLKLIGQYELLLENDGKKLIVFKHAIEYLIEVA